MPDSPSYSWDSDSLRYRDSRGRFVPERDIRKAADAVSDAATAELQALTERFNAGRANLNKLRERGREIIRDASVGSAAVAAGGRKQATPAVWGRVGRQLRDRYAELDGILARVASGEQAKDGGLVNQVANLGGSATRSYEAVRRDLMARGGYTEERRRRNSGHSCGPCVGMEAQGWVPVGTLPDIGDACDCHSNCRCVFQHRIRRKAKAKLPGYGHSEARVRDNPDDPSATVQAALTHARVIFGREVTARDLADLTGAPNGLVTVESTSPDGIFLKVRGNGFESERFITTDDQGRPAISNEHFTVSDEHRGKGLGASFFGRQVEHAARLGVARLDTEAAGEKGGEYNGYYTWPAFGYDGPLPYAVRARIDAGLIMPPHPAATVGDLMATPEGREWWKENGKSIEVTFDPTPGSRSRRVWDEYRARKVAEAGR